MSAETIQKQDEAFGFEAHHLMLSVRLKSGAVYNFAYGYLIETRLDGATLTLDFISREVHITGRNLMPLSQYLQGHRLGWVQEQGKRFDVGKTDDTYISQILIVNKEN